MKTNILPLILMILFIVSCKKDNHNKSTKNNSQNVLNSNTRILDTGAIIKTALNQVVFNTPSYIPKVGDILLASPSSKDTLGLLVKINAVSASGNIYTCSTVNSNLNDAFKELHINYTYNGDYANSINLSLRNKLGLNLSSNIHNYSSISTNGTTLAISFNNKKIAGTLTLNGNLKLNFPATTIKYIKETGALLPDTVIVNASFNTNSSSLTISSSTLQSSEISFDLPVKLPLIFVPIPVGPVVVLLPFTQKIVLKFLPVSISGKMELTVRPIISANLGMSYINHTFTNLSSNNIGASIDSLLRTNFDASMTASVTVFNPTYEIAPLGLEDENLFFSIPNDITATIQTTTPNYSVKYKLGVAVGINLVFWTGQTLTKSLDASLYEHTLTEGNWNYKIGDRAFGGIIFYIDSTKKHGKVIDSVDLGTNLSFPNLTRSDNLGNVYIYPHNFTLNVNSSTDTAKVLTTAIVDGGTAYNTTASTCINYKGGGFNDWFLPDIWELNLLFKVKDQMHTSLNEKLWSSNNAPAGQVAVRPIGPFYLNITDGTYGAAISSSGQANPGVANVRAIRDF